MIRACPRCTAEAALADLRRLREREGYLLDADRLLELYNVAERGLYAVADGVGGCCPEHGPHDGHGDLDLTATRRALRAKQTAHTAQWERTWAELSLALRAARAGERDAAVGHLLEAERLEYQLTGDCEAVGEAVQRYGLHDRGRS